MRFSLDDRSPSVMFEDLVHLTFKALAEVPDFRQAIEEIRRVNGHGRVAEETSYAVTSLSPREVDAMTCMRLMRRHWHIENKQNYVRDDSWREDRHVWRRGRTAYVSMLLSITLDLLRCRSVHWHENTPLTERA